MPNAKRTRDSFDFFSVLLDDLEFLFKRINDLIKLHYQLQTWNFHSQQLVTPTFCDIQGLRSSLESIKNLSLSNKFKNKTKLQNKLNNKQTNKQTNKKKQKKQNKMKHTITNEKERKKERKKGRKKENQSKLKQTALPPRVIIHQELYM